LMTRRFRQHTYQPKYRKVYRCLRITATDGDLWRTAVFHANLPLNHVRRLTISRERRYSKSGSAQIRPHTEVNYVPNRKTHESTHA
jgi:hypothetical protein